MGKILGQGPCMGPVLMATDEGVDIADNNFANCRISQCANEMQCFYTCVLRRFHEPCLLSLWGVSTLRTKPSLPCADTSARASSNSPTHGASPLPTARCSAVWPQFNTTWHMCRSCALDTCAQSKAKRPCVAFKWGYASNANVCHVPFKLC